ncbi:unnamed protein product [Mytilus edulis]|uniref:Uncharacterized protein n=1 Tax=Mytilus edulis TaxID=6550 RepID=A0A8S3SJL5_MYTED|nr:unnamed protein product [Mytilus edulis]
MSVSVDLGDTKMETEPVTEDDVPRFKEGRKRHPKEAAREATSINFDVNLTEAAFGHLELLEIVNEYPCLYCGPFKRRGIKRYEEFWLPLVASQNDLLAAPLDIEWIWHCHMLAPKAYIADCERMFGKIIDHKVFRMDEREMRMHKSQELWEKRYPKEPFLVDIPDADAYAENYGPDIDQSLCTHSSRLGYNIESATCRQGKFFHNVSLPHYRDKKYMRLAFERYQKFLYLKQCTEKTFLVPCYDIDLIWHTHQLHPIKYKEDTQRVLGKLLPHDDNTTDRSDGSKLSISYKITGKLWHELYGENYQYPGAMYRGETSRGRYKQASVAVPSEVQQKPVIVTFDFMALEKGKDGTPVKQYQVDVFMDFKDDQKRAYDNGRKLLMSLQGPNLECIAGEARPFEYDPVTQHNPLVIRLAKFRKEDFETASESGYSTRSEMAVMNTIAEKDELIMNDPEGSIRSQMMASARSKKSDKSDESISGSSGFSSCDDFMSEKSQESFLEAQLELNGIGDWVSSTQKMFQETISYEDSSGGHYMLYLSGRIEDRSDLCHFVLVSEEFETMIYPKDLSQIKIPEYTIYDPQENCRVCYFADQKMRDDKNGLSFTCRVMHSPLHTVSAVQIYHGEEILQDEIVKPIVTIRLVDSQQLPLPSMVFNGAKPCLTLDPRYKERGVLIQDNDGDWAIVVGSWFVTDDQPGTLRFKLYKCSSGIIKTLMLRYEENQCKITIESCTIDFQNGRLEIDAKSDELVQNIGLAFAIAILHVLCVPRPDTWKPGEPVVTPKTKHVFTDSMLFAHGVGLDVVTPSNHFREKRRQKK